VLACGSVTVTDTKRSAHALLLRAPQADAAKETGSYTLNFLWLDKNVAVSVDQMFSKVRARWERGTAGVRVAGVYACRVRRQGTAWGLPGERWKYECLPPPAECGAMRMWEQRMQRMQALLLGASLLTGARPRMRRRSGAP
jgi:hypothetical protein